MRPYKPFSVSAAAAVLVIIAFATLVPITLRPHTGHVHLERIGAYFALGALMGISFPHRWPWIMLGVVLIASGLEWLQTFIPTRDGRLADALEKTAGGLLGVSTGLIAAALEEHLFEKTRS